MYPTLWMSLSSNRPNKSRWGISHNLLSYCWRWGKQCNSSWLIIQATLLRSILLLRHQHHTKQCYGLNSDRLSRRDRLYCKLTETHFSELTSENYSASSYTDLNYNKHNNEPQYSLDQALKRFANSQLVVVFVKFLTMMATLITIFF